MVVALLFVSDISVRDSPCGCLTIDSYMDESYTLADLALDYIKSKGTTDQVFINYFGSGLADSKAQTDTYAVCPGHPDSQQLSHGIPIQLLTDDNGLNLSCADPYNSCANDADVANLGTYSVGNTL